MSRHRDIRSLNVQAELDDDALSDGGEDLTEDQEVQMSDAFEQVRAVLGDSVIEELSESAIREALWEFYFEIDQTVDWALAEYERRRVALERKDGEPEFHGAPPENGQSWSRLPKIMQAQPEGGYLDINEPPVHYPNRLSTITEHTEKTEAQSMFKPESTADRFADRTMSQGGAEMTSQSIDPNTIPLSPPASAIERLSLYEAPPSNSPSLSRSSTGGPRASGELVPAIEVIPEIPDYHSKSSKPAMYGGKTPSKLAQLASSRMSAVSSRSDSARSARISFSGTSKTFSALRPSAEAQRAPSAATSKELPPVPTASIQEESSVSSSIINKAIENALRLEEIDKTETPKRNRNISPTRNLLGQESSFSQAKKIVKPPSVASRSSHSGSQVSQRTLSASSQSSQKSASTVKPLSKLALLAQQKVEASRGPKHPETTTEYLTPIANGSSVTTAITTSYQSLYSLTDPNRSSVIPKLDVVPVQAGPSSATLSAVKPSKLALKAKRAHGRSLLTRAPPPLPELEYTPSLLPIFQPSPIHGRAFPSAFGSLLINDSGLHPEGLTEGPSWIEPSSHGSSDQGSRRSRHSAISTDSLDDHLHRSRKHKHFAPPSFSGDGATKLFTFDSPSPDDVVLRARQGTNLRKAAATSRTASSVGE